MLNRWSPDSSTLFGCCSFSRADTARWSWRTSRCSSSWLSTVAPDRSPHSVVRSVVLDWTAMGLAVLDAPVAPARRQAADWRRHPTPGPGDGRREPTLGRASHPWGIVEAGGPG